MALYKVVLTYQAPYYLEYSGLTNYDPGPGQHQRIFLYDPIAYSACTDFQPYLSDTGTTASMLSCGPLLSSGNTIGDYVIEWRLNSTGGTTVLVSGNQGNLDTSIEAYHTFSGDTAAPVPGGVLYPIIRYVYINGYRYVSTYDFQTNDRWSPDLIVCLDFVEVSNMNCSNGNLAAGGNYTHGIDYKFISSSASDATRSLQFDLNSDGSTKYFAWDFNGYDVPDTIKFTYSGSGTVQVLDYWTIGSQASPNYKLTGSTPKIWGSTVLSGRLRSVLVLTGITYTAGDFIRVDVTPNANTNTNWGLNMRCVTGTTFFDYNTSLYPDGYSVIDTSSIVLQYITGTSSCSYRISFNTYSAVTIANANTDNLYRYFSILHRNNTISNGSTSSSLTNTGATITYNYFTNYTTYSVYSGSNACIAANGTYDLSRVGDILTINNFSSANDYYIFKDGYYAVSGLTNMRNYVSDDTEINHFKRFTLQLTNSTGCLTDNYRQLLTRFHVSSPISFDDTNKIVSITVSGSTIGITGGTECDNLYNACNIQRGVTFYETIKENNVTSYNYNDFTWTNVSLIAANPFSGSYVSDTGSTLRPPSQSYATHLSYTPTVVTHNAILLPTDEWYFHSGSTGDGTDNAAWYFSYGNHWVRYKYNLRVNISDVDNPVGNTIIYSNLDNKGMRTGTWTEIWSG